MDGKYVCQKLLSTGTDKAWDTMKKNLRAPGIGMGKFTFMKIKYSLRHLK